MIALRSGRRLRSHKPREQQPEESLPRARGRARGPEEGIGDEERGEGRGEREQREAAVGEEEHRRHEQQGDENSHHAGVYQDARKPPAFMPEMDSATARRLDAAAAV